MPRGLKNVKKIKESTETTDIMYTNSASIGYKVARFSNLTVLDDDSFSVRKRGMKF